MGVSKLKYFLKNNWFYLALLALILAIAFFIRWHNLFSYNTYWADDGGAHIDYLKAIIYHHRLPTLAETYTAWHEPIYYLLLALWAGLGRLFGTSSLNWLESLNILFYGLFLGLVWLISYFYSQKNKWLALANFFLFSILFTGVKLSAYVNNEVLNQTLILLLVFLFLYWKLLSPHKEKKIFAWALILAGAVLVKITALIVLMAVIGVWLIKWFLTKQKYFGKYIFTVLLLALAINLPWVIYKNNNYNGYFSINIYDAKPRQNLVTSSGWHYIFAINTHVFKDYPVWFSQPNSYFSILLSDSFGDYYNMFEVGTENLPDSAKILVGNGRYTTPPLWQAMLNVNRLALIIAGIWWLGFGAWLFACLKNKKIGDYDLFILIVMSGGWLASIFHNLRLPYLEVGVLKAHFIYFTYPLLAMISYRFWWQVIKNKLWWFIVVMAPILIYLWLAWDILLVDAYPKI